MIIAVAGHDGVASGVYHGVDVAFDPVMTIATLKKVVAALTRQFVVPSIARQAVIPGAASENVIAASAMDLDAKIAQAAARADVIIICVAANDGADPSSAKVNSADT
jgi:hypothetical protein